jgi:hypothetical protein
VEKSFQGLGFRQLFPWFFLFVGRTSFEARFLLNFSSKVDLIFMKKLPELSGFSKDSQKKLK